MKRTKDIILEEAENRGSGHIVFGSSTGPNICCPSNPLRGSFKMDQFVLAEDPSDEFYKSGNIRGILTIDGETTYTVELFVIHNSKIIETKNVR